MSFEYYTKWWIVSKKHLEELHAKDEIFMKKAKPITDRHLANVLIGGLYARYSMLVQEIDSCLDQMAQPQKRMTVRKLMDAATIRLQELNEELRKIDISEYHYIDGSLIELKLVPFDVEILHPALFYSRPLEIEDMWKNIQKGEKIFVSPEPADEIPTPRRVSVVEKPPEESIADRIKRQNLIFSEEPIRTPEELMLYKTTTLIQTAERARQERMYFQIKQLLLKRHKETQASAPAGKTVEATSVDFNAPCQKIQAVWRGFSARQLLKAKETERRLLIGMYEPSWKSKVEMELYQKNLELRREYRDQRIREYIAAIDQEKARILRVVAPGLMEDIGDEIREWFHVWYKEIRMFDKYPAVAKGGTILVVRGETMTPKEYLDEYERKRREKVKNKGADKRKEKEKQEKLKKQAAEKKKKEAEKKKKAEEAKKKKKRRKGGEFEFEYVDSKSKDLYDKGLAEHKEIWDQINDFENPLEKHYVDMISEQKYYELQLEVRKDIDEIMRIELALLEEALEEDRIKLRKKGKGKKKKKKKKPKKKKRRGKRGKKDPTANRLTEDLFQELYDNGIIRTYPSVSLEDFKGDFSYRNWELRNLDFDPPATLADVRQAVIMNCIIPLGVETMKKPRSVLIAGTEQSGKHLLANAIFTETKCVLFDLSPDRTVGKYPGAKGMKMLLHLINKMSRLLAPSIIYFDGAEKIFYKKVPKEEKELDPKRIGKKLLKGIVKKITPQDRVLVLGITGKPWAAQAAKLKKAFERNILIPRTDYGSVHLYWRQLLMPYHGVDRNFNVTALAKVTVNYPFPVIKAVVDELMTERRIIQLRYAPLTPEEVYEEFVSQKLEPVSDKLFKKYLKWYSKTALGRERKIFNKYADEKRKAEAQQLEKEASKKKK